MKRLGSRRRAAAPRSGQVRSWDLVADQTENGSSFRILTLLDEHTRQACDSSCVLGPSDRCHYGDRSGHSLLWLPEHLRSDKGPEFIASCMHDWLKAQEIKRVTSSRGPLGETGISRPLRQAA
jgi:putative transposase